MRKAPGSGTEDLHQKHEPHPDPQKLTGHEGKAVDYEPYPEKSLNISPEHEAVVKAITNRMYSHAMEDCPISIGTYAACLVVSVNNGPG